MYVLVLLDKLINDLDREYIFYISLVRKKYNIFLYVRML